MNFFLINMCGCIDVLKNIMLRFCVLCLFLHEYFGVVNFFEKINEKVTTQFFL